MPPELIQCSLGMHVGVDSDDVERVDLMRQLCHEILHSSDVEEADFSDIAAPTGSKGSAFDFQTIVVTLAASGGVLTTFIGSIQRWLSRRDTTSVILEIRGDKLTISGGSSESERLLIKHWISHHTSSGEIER